MKIDFQDINFAVLRHRLYYTMWIVIIMKIGGNKSMCAHQQHSGANKISSIFHGLRYLQQNKFGGHIKWTSRD